MGSIDIWEQDTFVPSDYFSQRERLLIRGNCSIWLNFSESLSTYRGTWITFSDRLSTYQVEMFQLSNILRQSAYLSRVLLYFSQTNCHLVGRLKFTWLRCQMLRLTRKEWLTAHVVFLLKVCLAFYDCSFLSWNFPWIVKLNEKFFLQNFRHCFICIAIVMLLQFLTFISDHSV